MRACLRISLLIIRQKTKKAAKKPAASTQPPKATPSSEINPTNVPDNVKAESSGVQNDVEVRAHHFI